MLSPDIAIIDIKAYHVSHSQLRKWTVPTISETDLLESGSNAWLIKIILIALFKLKGCHIKNRTINRILLNHYNHERPWVMAVLRLYRNQTMHLNAINSMRYAWDDYLTSWMLRSLATLIKALWSIVPRLAISSVHSIKILTFKHQSGGFLKKAFSFKTYNYPTQSFV